GQEDPVDVIHVFGGSAWTFALEVATALGVPIALDVWRAGIISRAASIHQPMPALFAPDERMGELIRTTNPEAQVRVTPWGVHVPGDDRTILRRNVSPAIVIGGSGRDKQAFHQVAEALALIIRSHPDVVVFFDAAAAHRSGIWKAAKESGILDHISLIDELEVHRELVLRADLLLFPEATGEHRTLLLDAMAHQMVIVAAADDAQGALRDETACIIRDAVPTAWSSAIRELLEHPERARAIGASARSFIKDHHRGSAHVASVLDAYEWMTSSDSVPFDQ
ncbi:MAG: glycosyltransferase, partial [Phycisphaerales bacterium]|nr:glycosyltransferase [Phycisphaerales bacterium]